LGIVAPKGKTVEGINPFWWTVGLVAAWTAGLSIPITMLSGLFWLSQRSRVSLLIFFVMLGGTIMSGLTFGIACVLMSSKWP
jgi:hypothetical protein